MCLFPLPNFNVTGLAFKKGVVEFDCGACPECLRKRSNVWSLRSVYEAKCHTSNLMITLTYDQFKYFDGKSNVELPADPTIEVDKSHIQKFIKRLRRWISYHNPAGCDLINKYIACAEYGSRTHRAHYHLILFGVDFADKHYYKKSKRGNVIYMSSTLTRLWGKGICTIDSVNVSSAAARYCTKYCAKSRSDKTFMLCSQGIGVDNLIKDFNGISYFIDGHEYPIPRIIWEHYIMNKYSRYSSIVSPKYVNFDYDKSYAENVAYYKSLSDRKRYRYLRDRDCLYIRYLDYWHSKGLQFEQNQLSSLQRIYLLDDSKFHNYRIAALDVYAKRLGHLRFFPAPGSNCVSAHFRFLEKNTSVFNTWTYRKMVTCPIPPRPNRASDTKEFYVDPFDGLVYHNFDKFSPINHFISSKLLTSLSDQLIIDL